ncbi:MAG: YihY/virulence factor BrkB family protein [Bacteroidales bacterium]|jgi:membrane protein|nr:YihY/virulence factor BrkB family protein [Bacteroidales bacterium]
MDKPSYERTYRIFDKQIHRLGEKLRKISLPGFDKVPLYDVIWFFSRGLQKGSLNTRATSIAFNFMLALGPGIIFLIALIPYLPIANFQQELFNVFDEIMPENSYIAIESLLNEIFKKRSGLPLFGFLVSLFFAQKGIHGMIEAFNATFHTIETRSWYTQRLIAIVLVFIFYSLILLATLIMFLNKIFIEILSSSGYIQMNITFYFFIIGKWIVIVGLTFFCISFLYYLAPQRKTKWRFFSAGSTLATILTVVASLGFSYFVNNFAQFNRFFGSIGALIALMLWLNFNALVLLIGFELNASIKNANLTIQEP